jgi:Flp pilus assembly protein TadG
MTRLRDGHDRGQSAVEFALVIPIFLLMVFGILDLGRAVYAYSTLNNAAREAARLAILDQTLDDIKAYGAGQATGLGITPDAVTVDWRTAELPDTPDSCAALAAAQDSSAITCTAIVRVEYVYTAATPLIGTIVGNIQMAGESRMTLEFGCVDGPPPPLTCPVGE